MIINTVSTKKLNFVKFSQPLTNFFNTGSDQENDQMLLEKQARIFLAKNSLDNNLYSQLCEFHRHKKIETGTVVL
jgi:hypothetical protein